MELRSFIEKANAFGSQGIPFLFLLDFELKKPVIHTLEEAEKEGVYFQIKGLQKNGNKAENIKPVKLDIFPMEVTKYEKAFLIAMDHLLAGNTYLLNITFPTPIAMDRSLVEIFQGAEADYKLLFKDQFTIFSPECFVRTQKDHIYSYPMKGTIDADLPNAAQRIMADKKETWEHNTIVDLIRNDLAMVANDITVRKFRFLSEIHTNRKNLLQVSSEIRGELPSDWRERIGDILGALTPAGSISGAPKQRTIEIIKEAEKADRGYFTGVFGIFDGRDLDSAVNIRYIERTENGLQFRSGGGITANSDPKNEYLEMVNKVYVPIA
ncbi:MAG: aminodeoxychorismate synthase component I [Candidatus Marinimicrobia bacterium]|nr:aminodeoxychorismate synthase component I [Candidatus Neomarinimicrobiota bacterium]